VIFRQLFDQVSGTYSYLLASRPGGEALIIDPVLEKVDRYLQLVRELDLKLVKALDTHLHADHITGLGASRDRTHCITVMGEQTKADGPTAWVTRQHAARVVRPPPRGALPTLRNRPVRFEFWKRRTKRVAKHTGKTHPRFRSVRCRHTELSADIDGEIAHVADAGGTPCDLKLPRIEYPRYRCCHRCGYYGCRRPCKGLCQLQDFHCIPLPYQTPI
jgi:ribonuclease BN (tRNA processing enzyme)